MNTTAATATIQRHADEAMANVRAAIAAGAIPADLGAYGTDAEADAVADRLAGCFPPLPGEYPEWLADAVAGEIGHRLAALVA